MIKKKDKIQIASIGRVATYYLHVLTQHEILPKSFCFFFSQGQIKSAETFISERSSTNSPSPASGDLFTGFLTTLLALEGADGPVDIAVEFPTTGFESSGRSSSDRRRTREAMDEDGRGLRRNVLEL